eukprot:1381783-Amorphochlora_amoeboformis.AAC.1
MGLRKPPSLSLPPRLDFKPDFKNSLVALSLTALVLPQLSLAVCAHRNAGIQVDSAVAEYVTSSTVSCEPRGSNGKRMYALFSHREIRSWRAGREGQGGSGSEYIR